mmetsp:Transcript_11922/g.27826  ORF Transcript_11922/g.27826 Transcript_11922/m.27826 type:complete len:643 (+) Transcript_11922:81-2009(+)
MALFKAATGSCHPCASATAAVPAAPITANPLRDAGMKSTEGSTVPSDLVAWLEHRLHLQCSTIQAQHKEIVSELVRRCEVPLLDAASLDAAAAAFTVTYAEDGTDAERKEQQASVAKPLTAQKWSALGSAKASQGQCEELDRRLLHEARSSEKSQSQGALPMKQVSWNVNEELVGESENNRASHQGDLKSKASFTDEHSRGRRSTRVDIESLRDTLQPIVDGTTKPTPEEPVTRCQRKFQEWVHSIQFEVVTNSIILLNAALLAVETQFDGVNAGADLWPHKYHKTDAMFGHALQVANFIFTIWFTLELLMRLLAGRAKALREFWIWFDTAIVVFGLLELLQESAIQLDLNLLRLARLARMMRVFRLVEMIRAFDSLYLLVRSIQASIGALIWSFVFLMALQVACGLCLSQLLRPVWEDDEDNSYSLDVRLLIFSYFGTFSRMLVTMFEITIGNWVPSCRALMDNVSDWYGLFYILYTCCFCFAIVRVITAVFITETQRVVSNDDKIALRKKEKEKEAYLARLRHMSAELDASGDGRVSYEEFAEFIHKDEMKMWLATLDINSHELDNLFRLLDNGEGEIEVEEFITGVSRLKGPATSIDVVTILKTVNTICAKVSLLTAHLEKQPSSLERMQFQPGPLGQR